MLLNSYFSYSRKERIGILALLTLILSCFGVSFYLRYHATPEANIEEVKLYAAWQKHQMNQEEIPILNTKTNTSALFTFDPNTLDSSGWTKLGLEPRTIHLLLNWRNKGKHFYKKEDLKQLYSLSAATYERIAPYIAIQEQEHFVRSEFGKALPPLSAHIDLNKIDSATLTRLDGIGSILAHKIVERRRVLGGFLKHEQLMEIYKFNDTVFAYLKEKLPITTSGIHKLKLNSATEAELSIHPYIGEKMAKNIILLRSGLRKYEKIEQLRQVPLMVDEKYRKIAPYCSID